MFRKTLALASLVLLAATAQAEKPRFGDTISLALGGMNHRGKANFASTREGAPIDELSFTDLGLDDETSVFWADFTWQFAERWQFSLTATSFDANGFNMTSESGNFGQLEWEVGAALTTSFDLDLYIADITWDFIKTDNAHVGVGVGLHAADLDLDLLLEVGGGIGGIGGVVEVTSETASVLAPLPNVSLVGGVMLGEKVYLSGHMGFLSLSIDKYDGELFSVRGALEWRPWKNVGLGAAYQLVDIDLEVDGTNKQELYDFQFYGPILFVSVGF